MQKLRIRADHHAGFVAEDPVEHLLREGKGQGYRAGSQVDPFEAVIPHAFQLPQGDKQLLRLGQDRDFIRLFQQHGIQHLLHRMGPLQRIQPPGQMHMDLMEGELIQQCLHQFPDPFPIQALAVADMGFNAMLLPDPVLYSLGLRRFWLPGIDDDQKGLAGGAHILNGPPLRDQVVPCRDLRDAAVGGHHQPQGAMLLHDLLGAQLCRLGHGDLVVEPGGGDHPGHPLIVGTHCSLHHIAHRVNKPHLHPADAVGRDLRRLLGNKFRLRGHNDPAGTALGQFIPGPLLLIRVFNARDHQLLHDPFDQGGFSGAYRSHHADVDIPAGAQGHILINMLHSQPPVFRQEVAPAMGLHHGMSSLSGIEPESPGRGGIDTR